MPRPGPRRIMTGAPMTQEQRDAIWARAKKDGVKPSDVIRSAVNAYLDLGNSTGVVLDTSRST